MQSQTLPRTTKHTLGSFVAAGTLLLCLLGMCPQALADELADQSQVAGLVPAEAIALDEVQPLSAEIETPSSGQGEVQAPAEGEDTDGQPGEGDEGQPGEGDEGTEGQDDESEPDGALLSADLTVEGSAAAQKDADDQLSPTTDAKTPTDTVNPLAGDPTDQLDATNQATAPLDGEALTAAAYVDRWVYESGSYYYYDETGNKKTGWHVDARTPQGESGDLQRYWLDNTTGALATNRLIDASESGWWAFARPLGIIVRGKYADPTTGFIYIANNNGKLEDPGWVVSDSYGDGLQRYYVDENVHACIPGYSTKGWNHYTTDYGYVTRGLTNDNGVKRYANNDGYTPEGWFVTRDLGQGLQRYWQQSGVLATDKLIKTGASSWAYARPEGYVVRGIYVSPTTGYVYLADNDGNLESPGWLITNAYHGNWQRYYIDFNSHAAQPGFLRIANMVYYALNQKGYCLRGKLSTTKGVLLADNDGLLAENVHGAGWAVTDAYDAGLQRYYLQASSGHLYARTGFFVVNNRSYFGEPGEGYVARNTRLTYKGSTVKANNQGVLRYLTGVLVTIPIVDDGNPLRVLLVGNSFTSSNNNRLASVLAQLTGAQVVTRTLDGMSLNDCRTQANAVGAQVMADLGQDGWDFVVFQEQSTRALDNYSGYYSDLSYLANRARNVGATPIVYATWAFSGGSGGASSRGISLNAMHNQLQSAFSRAASSLSAPVANVGQAFANRSYVKSLYDTDGKHPSRTGSTLAGQIIARLINSLL